MISILRSGPKLIVFGSTKVEDLTAFLKENLSGMVTDLNSALEIAEEDNTVVFITGPGKKVAVLNDIKSIVLIPKPSDYVFSSLITLGGASLIADSHTAPGNLIMRTIGDFDKIAEAIENTYGGKTMPLLGCLDRGNSSQAILSFTEKPLNKKLSLSDLKHCHMLIDMDANRLYKRMRSQALRFLNEGLVGVNWNDVQIRIYDRYSKYKLHYDRLSLILDNLEIGLILGETWSKDYPRFLLSVLVYQVRLFTLLDPVEIKRILLGLEYLDDGTRIVDLDLIWKGQKVDWPQAIEKNTSGYDRKDLAIVYRKQMLDKLDPEDKDKLSMLEEQILKSRY